ncbi:hypothetical protein BJY00DRAFT_295437 [Aspergillus carlsbadensis]|nr:hypothetical protein BJY00DRAFT_295437 [Aspergillus carlsbadensis]
MLSRARTIFRKLRGRGRRGSQSAPSNPASEPAGPPPRAIHITVVRRSPTPTYRRPFPNQTPMSIIVADATGVSVDLYKLLQRDTGLCEYDPTDDGDDAEYLCDGWVYNVSFIAPPTEAAKFTGYYCLAQHFCLVFTYKSLSRESWDETVAAVKAMRRRCEENNVHPFLATAIAAVGEEGEDPAVPHAEAEAFAAHQDALFFKISPRTGHGICDAVGLLVERANGARDQYPDSKEGKEQRYKRVQAFEALFTSEG